MIEVLLGATLIVAAVALAYVVRYGRTRSGTDRDAATGTVEESAGVVEADASCITGDNRSVTTTVRLTFEQLEPPVRPGPGPSWFLERMTVTALRDAVGGRDAVDLDAEHRAVTDHVEQVLDAAAKERGLTVTGLRIDRFVPHASGP